MNVEPTHQTPWDWRAAIQFISGGTGTGLLLFTALAALEDPVWLMRTGLLALAFVGLGLFFVWLKLGRRLRALYVFLNPQTSWMSREAIFSICVMIFGLAGIFLRSNPLTMLAAACGLGYLYSQARILKESRGIPAWREPWTVPLMTLTGLTEGAAILLGGAAIFGGTETWLLAALFVLVGARWYSWNQYRLNLLVPGAAPMRTVEALTQTGLIAVPWGHAAPAVLLLASLILALMSLPSAARAIELLAGFAALAGGWYLKFNMMTRAAYNQGFSLARTPARTPGFGGGSVKPGWTTPEVRPVETEAPRSGKLVHAFKSGEVE
jgi:phenylacetyl-CoA:acceptor oxidoreductase 26-kDa subunit